MQIVCTPISKRYGGIVEVINHQFEVKNWNPNTTPVYDFFDTNKPDIIFCSDELISEHFIAAVAQHKDAKIVVFGSRIPHYFNVDLVCIEPSLNFIMRKNIQCDNILEVPDYANIHNIKSPEIDPRLKCEVGLLADSAQTMHMVNNLLIIGGFFNLKCVGDYHIPVPSYLGKGSPLVRERLIASSCLMIDFDNTHFLDFAARKKCTLCLTPNKFFPTFNIDNIRNLLQNDALRKKIAQTAFDNVKEHHTSYHRVKDIFHALNMTDQEEEIGKLLWNTQTHLV